MATIILSAVGTALGGPIGGAIGSLLGSQIDGAIFKPSSREGPRLKELGVTTSSYGSAISRQFGKVRASGTIIWATDLIETSEKSGGGKGKPSTVTYSYSASFAVALSSRPIISIGRIWADGNLLRGSGGDLKVPGELRMYSGHGDQLPDPLLASAEAGGCPAFRGLAYCVFEGLQLAEFGNRIPALTFELVCDTGTVSLADVVEPAGPISFQHADLIGLDGFADEGGSLAASLASISQIYAFSCDAGGDGLHLVGVSPVGSVFPIMPEPVIDPGEEGFGGLSGHKITRVGNANTAPSAMRYYDFDRDYLPGLQNVSGRVLPGAGNVIEFPGVLTSDRAKHLANLAAQRSALAQERISWRIAEIDPGLAPGQVVHLPEIPGLWRIETWEWRESGLELELLRQPQTVPSIAFTDPGRLLPPRDDVATPTILQAFELPWDGLGSNLERQVFAAASSESAGWKGAMLYAESSGNLVPLTGSGSDRSVLGSTLQSFPARSTQIIDRESVLDVQLVSADFDLISRPLADVMQGANRALVGNEIIQFATAQRIDGAHWQLSGMLRGRGGTEAAAAAVLPAGAPFVLLDDRNLLLQPGQLGSASAIAAIGLVDVAPVSAPIRNVGRTLEPLCPVHPKTVANADGSLTLCWTRRARGAWNWDGTVEPPLAEQSELYEVGVGNPDQPLIAWQTGAPTLLLDQASRSQLHANYPGQPVWVRQIGTFARSDATFLTTIS